MALHTVKVPISREIKGVIFYNVIKIMAPVCTLVHLQSRLGHRDQRTSRSFPYFCSGKKVCTSLPGPSRLANFRELTIDPFDITPKLSKRQFFFFRKERAFYKKRPPYKNSHLKSISVFPQGDCRKEPRRDPLCTKTKINQNSQP